MTALPPDGLSALTAFARLFLAAVYAWSAGGKILWPTEFRGLLVESGMLPASLVEPTAIALPIIELALALALIWIRLRTIAAAASTFLSLVFSGVHAHALVAGSVIRCGCIGVVVQYPSSGLHTAMLVLSIAMLGASLTLLFSSASNGRLVVSRAPSYYT
jgi:hypothetical protein